jgi:hypothetical protein
MNLNEHILNITRKGLRRGDIVLGPSGLYKISKATVVNNLERSVILCYPTDKLSTASSVTNESFLF